MSIASQFARVQANAYDNGGDKAGFMAARAYQYWRRHGRPAAQALALAREDAAAERGRYGETHGASYQNAPNDNGGRWIENPGAAGLRFVGFSDQIAGRAIEHTGWFLDGEFQKECARGAVYQMPARNGRPVYVEAVRMGSTDRNGTWRDQSGVEGSALVYLGEWHAGEPGGAGACAGGWRNSRYVADYAEPAMLAAARCSDREAELLAEAERDYQDAWRAANEWQELGEHAATMRSKARALIADMRAARRTGATATATICDALRSKAREYIADMREALADRAKIASDFAWREAPGAPALDVAAFAAINL